MKTIKNNFHTHTKRCGHARGEDEEYVLAAISCGLKRLGFSDHIILCEPYSQPGIRGNPSLLQDYLDSINYLKEKYKDQIEIFVGFEAEYFPVLMDYYKDLLKNKIDYLILGQHCYRKDDQFHWYRWENLEERGYDKYVDDVIEGLKTGLFKYLCHPDLFLLGFPEFNEEAERESRRLLKACEELNIPIELNLCGMRRRTYDGHHFSYPSYDFFKLVKEYNVKVVLAIDAHDPFNICQEEIDKGFKFAEDCGVIIDENYDIFDK